MPQLGAAGRLPIGRICTLILWVGLAALTGSRLAGAAEAGTPAGDPWGLCARHAARIGPAHDLPPHLLSAISKVESGRWRAAESAVLAWPWTVTAGGEGRFLATKAEAIETVRALRAQGQRNIDVGCMQVNLMHHPDAFESLEAAFDPVQNITYAARLLQRLRQEESSWTKAIAFYHSRTPKFNGPYRLKVFRAWREERHRANLAQQAAAEPQQAAEAHQQTALNP